MDEPISWQSVQGLRALIETVTVANGFYTDLGSGEIFTDRAQVKENSAPCTLLLSGEFVPQADASGPRTTATLMQGKAEYVLPLGDGSTNPELLAHRGRADLLRAFKTDLRGEARCWRKLEVTGSRILSSEAGASVIVAQIDWQASLSEFKLPAA